MWPDVQATPQISHNVSHLVAQLQHDLGHVLYERLFLEMKATTNLGEENLPLKEKPKFRLIQS